jgi:hypothetical protein
MAVVQDRLGTEIVEMDGGHSPFLARPDDLVQVLLELRRDGWFAATARVRSLEDGPETCLDRRSARVNAGRPARFGAGAAASRDRGRQPSARLMSWPIRSRLVRR